MPSSSEKFYKWLFVALALASVVLVVLISGLLVQGVREKKAHDAELEALLVELADTLQDTEDKQEYLDRLVRDADFREQVIREKLGRVRADDTIYHFK